MRQVRRRRRAGEVGADAHALVGAGEVGACLSRPSTKALIQRILSP
jgi:hypothetical protein